MDAEELNTAANKAYQAGKLQDALALYTNAIQAQPDCAKYLCNRAAVHLQLREHDRAQADASAALAIDPRNLKALLRRALAWEALGEFVKAHDDLRNLLDTDVDVVRERGALSASMSKLALTTLGNVKSAIRALRAQQPESAQGLCHAGQSLRLNFRESLPAAIPADCWTGVSLCTTNEFGLFRQGTLPGVQPPLVECSLAGGSSHLCELQLRKGALRLDSRGRVDFEFKLKPVICQDPGSVLRICLRVDASGILAVLSLPIRVLAAGDEVEVSEMDEDGVSCCRELVVPGLPHGIILKESPGQVGIGGKMWDAGVAMCEYLAACLLYTSDAADEEDSVDLGGRRIIKKKNKEKRDGYEEVSIVQDT
eukprot:TRINITY_DN49271_c0_g1_i1.p1 TRINITY_DN49271_c0_g1~~TRINITY_DN49271_c0_g1_i1.p1  ORF type:complete len:367 (+),score=71.02 TRINITY_DN49271_c0_g1_i1:201-1301(+)